MRSWKSSSVSALAFGAVLALTACGSGGDEAASSASPPSPSSSAGAPGAGAPASAGAPSAPAAAATGAAEPATPPAAAEPEAAAGPGACAAADLTGTIEDNIGGGAAGSVYRSLVLTNSSAAACTALPGFPGVSYIDAAGEQLGAAAVRTDGTATADPLVLEPGQSAVSELRETRAENYGAECVPHPATQLRVYPPEDLESVVLQHEAVACENPNVQLLSVGPLQKR